MASDKVVNLDEKRPHVVHEVICVKCHFRWMAVAPPDIKLKDYGCGNCGQGYVILTGQPLSGKFGE